MTRLGLLLVGLATALPLAAQQAEPRFEVASVKASKAGLPGPIWGGSPGRFVVDGVTAAKLERTRGLVDVLVIDSVERPTPN